jgi:MFS family permease
MHNPATHSESSKINKESLFFASCVALVVTSMTFAIRAGMLEGLGKEFGLTSTQLGYVAGTAFWGFPLAVIFGGFVVDKIGMRVLMVAAFACHVLGIIMTIFAQGFWTLFFSTLLIGLANGLVEAVCNPLVASLYPNNKTVKLNHFHLWFPGGIVIGGLVSYFLKDKLGMSWHVPMATMLIPAAIYGYLMFKETFPVTERISKGVSDSKMFSALLSPLFIFMVICMFGTAITELGTGQWIDVLLKGATSNPILLLVSVAGVQALGRAFAGPLVHSLSPKGVLLSSAIISLLGLYLFSTMSGGMLFAAAAIFGIGVTYFWPTMIGFVAENIPDSGAAGMSVIGGMGMFAVSIFQPIIGKIYDSNLTKVLPTGADLSKYNNAPDGSAMAIELAKAKLTAGPAVLQTMTAVPILLIIAFGALYFYKKK